MIYLWKVVKSGMISCKKCIFGKVTYLFIVTKLPTQKLAQTRHFRLIGKISQAYVTVKFKKIG